MIGPKQTPKQISVRITPEMLKATGGHISSAHPRIKLLFGAKARESKKSSAKERKRTAKLRRKQSPGQQS